MENTILHFDVLYDTSGRNAKFSQLWKLVGSERKTNEFDKALRHKVSIDSCLNP